MKIAIIDTINQDVGLKILFPDSDYFSIVEQFDRTVYYNRYNFNCRRDIETINSEIYDTLFVISPLYNTLKQYKLQENTSYNKEFDDCLRKVFSIINSNNFKRVCIFDNYDYDYDPNIIFNEHETTKNILFFKRNFNKTKTYYNNVFPFPYIIFGHRCNIDMINNLRTIVDDKEKINRLFFAGSIFTHIDNVYGEYRDRKMTIQHLQNILPKDLLYISNYSYDEYMYEMCRSKYCLDLLGCGDPNIRSFEIFSTQTLRIAERSKICWTFSEDFCEETYFDNPEDLRKKLLLLQSDNTLYNRCLEKQNMIVKKYMNKEYLRNYITDIVEQMDYIENIVEKPSKIVLITSIINISSHPLSYTPIRSVFSIDQRFQQTKNTIESIRKQLPDYKIMYVECSDLTIQQIKFFKENVDIFLNMFNEPKREEYIAKINSPSKSLGEGTITKFAIEYLLKNEKFESFVKISGRYWINDKFDKNTFLSNSIVVNPNIQDKKNICTSLYKLSYETTKLWYEYLLKSDNKFNICEGYEIIFGEFINSISHKYNISYVPTIGVSGFISVDGKYMEW